MIAGYISFKRLYLSNKYPLIGEKKTINIAGIVNINLTKNSIFLIPKKCFYKLWSAGAIAVLPSTVIADTENSAK